MAKRKARIIVACGSGVATSTLAAQRVKEVCEDNGFIPDVRICSINEVENLAEGVDIVVTTTKFSSTTINKPVISAVSFVTGVGEGQTVEQLVNALKSIPE